MLVHIARRAKLFECIAAAGRLTAVLDGQGAEPSDGGAAHGDDGRLVAGALCRHRRLHHLRSATASSITR